MPTFVPSSHYRGEGLTWLVNTGWLTKLGPFCPTSRLSKAYHQREWTLKSNFMLSLSLKNATKSKQKLKSKQTKETETHF